MVTCRRRSGGCTGLAFRRWAVPSIRTAVAALTGGRVPVSVIWTVVAAVFAYGTAAVLPIGTGVVGVRYGGVWLVWVGWQLNPIGELEPVAERHWPPRAWTRCRTTRPPRRSGDSSGGGVFGHPTLAPTSWTPTGATQPWSVWWAARARSSRAAQASDPVVDATVGFLRLGVGQRLAGVRAVAVGSGPPAYDPVGLGMSGHH